MFERFTDKARRVIVLAQEEARMFNHNYIGTEHILLGLLRVDDSIAAKALESLGCNVKETRKHVAGIIGEGVEPPTGMIPFTPRAKKVQELALREAMQLGHNYVGTEHLLLGLIREGEGVAAQVLVKGGMELTRVRQQVILLLTGDKPADPNTISGINVTLTAGGGAGGGGGTAKVSRSNVLHRTYVDPPAPRWLDLITHPHGVKMTIDLNKVTALIQHDDHTELHFESKAFQIKDSIKEIFGE